MGEEDLSFSLFLPVMPSSPSANFSAQNRKKAMAFRLTSWLNLLFVKAIRQFTQSVKAVVSVSVMYGKYSLTIFSIVSKASNTILLWSSVAAVVKTYTWKIRQRSRLVSPLAQVPKMHLESLTLYA